MMLSCLPEQLDSLGPRELSDALERGNIVFFPRSPIPFPSPEDLVFLREEMPRHLRRKNLSYHPEVDRVVGLPRRPGVRERITRILRDHLGEVRRFLERAIPTLARGWTVGTSSFRPLEEKGRALSAHASNERVHVDAGAYGATHGNRILRFFMNANSTEDRVWITKGAFPEVYRRYGQAAGIAPRPLGDGRSLELGLQDRLRTGMLGTLARMGLPQARLLDSSPYDRLMRRFHNFMKDTPEFQNTPEGHREFSFPPFSAWMVFTDMVSHACISGQHALIDTFIVPLGNCSLPEFAPYHILSRAP
ncbi:MAG TPA: Kdo hydroxylase family protein [Planctomycetota bacterium]|nr:Kdo hydroxylase family protein [Planctomycetota bacterium]